jgi:hypothetical protein
MTTNYHTPLEDGQTGTAATFNEPLGQLDSAVGLAVAAAEVAQETVLLAGGATTLTNGAAAAGQQVVPVDSSAGMVAGCLVEYALVGGVRESNVVASVDSATQITLTMAIGTGGIANDALISVMPIGLANLRVGVRNVLDFGASPSASAATNTAAIRAAIAATPNGGTVVIPAGCYTINGSLEAVAYPGNSGQLKTLYVLGAGNSCVSDIYDSDTHATTLRIASAADTPVFKIDHTRGARLMDLNILGDDSTEADSCGVWFSSHNVSGLLERVTIGGFAEGIRVGTEGQAGANDDNLTIRQCMFQDCAVAIRNYSTSSYGMKLLESEAFVSVGTVYRTSDYGGVCMNSIKIQNCLLDNYGPIIELDLSTACPIYDVATIEGCTIECYSLEGPVPPVLFKQTVGEGYHQNGLVIRDNIIAGPDIAGVYATDYRMIDYIGSGPFVFENNRVSHVRPVFYLDSYDGGGSFSTALRIMTNGYSHRPVILWPDGTAYPMIYEAANYWYFETSQAVGGGVYPCAVFGQIGTWLAGRCIASPSDTYAGATYGSGSFWGLAAAGALDTINSASMAYVRIPGTSGTITGVTGTVANGQASATLTGGAAAEKAKIYSGCWIQIGTSGPLQVAAVLGNTIYLRSTYGGSTQTAQALTYYPPVLHREWYITTSAPGVAGVGGDVAWRTTVGAGESPGWVYTTGGWKAMASVDP